MYCPNCGQQQISGEMRFCSRCGFALSGLAEWMAGGRLPVKRVDEAKVEALSPRSKGIRRAAKLMFFSGVLFPLFLALAIAIEAGEPLVIPVVVFFLSLVWMLYARLFLDQSAPVDYQTVNQHTAQTTAFGPYSTPGYLPPAPGTPIGRTQVRTNELAQQPASVTENTTRLLDDE